MPKLRRSHPPPPPRRQAGARAGVPARVWRRLRLVPIPPCALSFDAGLSILPGRAHRGGSGSSRINRFTHEIVQRAHARIHARARAHTPQDGATALHVACQEGHAETVRALLQGGADVEAQYNVRPPLAGRPAPRLPNTRRVVAHTQRNESESR